MPSHHSHSDPRLQEVFSAVPADQAESLKEVWDLVGDASVVSTATRVSTWRRIEDSIADPALPARPAMRLIRMPVMRRFAVAACVALVAAVGYLSLPDYTVYAAEDGLQAEYQLADGSSVVLAPGSELKVREGFGEDARLVRLDGEAFFDVTPASDHGDLPFRIETFNASVEVVGTAFNVRAHRGDMEAQTMVAVEHGVVRVAADDAEVELLAGQGTQVEAQEQPSLPVPVNLDRALAWRTGGLAFDGVPMGVVFAELERRYDLRIDAPVSISRLDVSYWRAAPVNVSEVLADLADVVDAEIRRTANGYEVYRSDR